MTRAKQTLCLRLYVAGSAPNSLIAIRNIRALSVLLNSWKVELEILDTLKEPGRAWEDNVLMTPMLVRLSPGPQCQVFGNLSDAQSVLGALGLEEK